MVVDREGLWTRGYVCEGRNVCVHLGCMCGVPYFGSKKVLQTYSTWCCEAQADTISAAMWHLSAEWSVTEPNRALQMWQMCLNIFLEPQPGMGESADMWPLEHPRVEKLK